ncbi:hypothetical protein L227DRAFT_57161 [Lentinus tigrinus ALCF2SS1-6]|uniref:Uncharacterized protein n=1 Tax=Lentinus tigrinus ALCF2SS1-6 TaxID=1328759 RepID=A0A5C2SCX3_9APHY|nr:hypothetical protein L227DRAFT_57161 [Lentinus tigrinus ALCF2SS1-6]
MPPALSPSGRVRSRTSDISDFLRGRHDAKISSDLPPPPVPLLPDPVTPPKHKSKFGFLGRKRKPSFSPSSAKTSAAVAATAAAAIATSSGGNNVHPTDHVHGGTQPSPAGPSGRTPSRDLPPLPPLDVIAPGYKPRSDPTRNSGVLSPTKGQYASPSSVLHNIRKQKGSFESSRRSTDSRSSMRPIITVSPPHNTMHETADAYTAPRSAPSPAPPSPLRPNECSLPTPTASDMSDRTATPETPTSAEIPSPSTSTHSVAQYPPISPSDPPLATATSYKEESLLRQDHFEINESASTPRRGTVSFNSSNPTPPATVGFSPSRQERRHISVLQLNRLKKEITATAPKIRKMPSDPKSLATPTSNVSLSRSNTIAASPPHTPHSPQGSRSPTPQQQRRIPPPLKRTWSPSHPLQQVQQPVPHKHPPPQTPSAPRDPPHPPPSAPTGRSRLSYSQGRRHTHAQQAQNPQTRSPARASPRRPRARSATSRRTGRRPRSSSAPARPCAKTRRCRCSGTRTRPRSSCARRCGASMRSTRACRRTC